MLLTGFAVKGQFPAYQYKQCFGSGKARDRNGDLPYQYHEKLVIPSNPPLALIHLAKRKNLLHLAHQHQQRLHRVPTVSEALPNNKPTTPA